MEIYLCLILIKTIFATTNTIDKIQITTTNTWPRLRLIHFALIGSSHTIGRHAS